MLSTRHIFCDSLWMARLKWSSVTVLNFKQDQSQQQATSTIEEIVDFSLNAQKFNLQQTTTTSSNTNDIAKRIQTIGEFDVSVTGIEVTSSSSVNDKKEVWTLSFESMYSIAKFSLLRPTTNLRSPFQHFAVLEIKTNVNHEKFIIIGSSYHSTSLLFDSACILWKRQNDMLDSELHRALFKSRPIDEALHVIASLPFSCFGSVTSKSGAIDTLMRKSGFRDNTSAAGSNNDLASNQIRNTNNTGNNSNLDANDNNNSTNGSGERDVRIEISPDGILQIWLLPKDFHSMKYDDLQFFANSGKMSSSAESIGKNSSSSEVLSPSSIFERFPKCVFDLSTLIDCRLSNSTGDAASAGSSGDADSNTKADESIIEGAIATTDAGKSSSSKQSGGTTAGGSASSSSSHQHFLAASDRLTKEASKISAATANHQILQTQDEIDLFVAKNHSSSPTDGSSSSASSTTEASLTKLVNQMRNKNNILFLVLPDATTLAIKLQFPDHTAKMNSNSSLASTLMVQSSHLAVSSIVDIFYACAAARPWLQPSLNNNHQTYQTAVTNTTSNSNSNNTNRNIINLENLVPGAIQPFTRKEIAQCQDMYNSLQRDIAKLCAVRAAKNNQLSQILSHFPNLIRTSSSSNSNSSSSSNALLTSLAALTLTDIPVIVKSSILARNSETDQDLFLRKVLECCLTACYTNICTQPQLAPEAQRLLNFSDFLFMKYVLERGGVNLRIMMVYGGIVRSFFHRSSGGNSDHQLQAINESVNEDHNENEEQNNGKENNSSSKRKSFIKNKSSKNYKLSFTLSIWKKVLKTLELAKSQNVHQHYQHSSSAANDQNSMMKNYSSSQQQQPTLSLVQAAKKMESDAEALWQCALATFGQDCWETKMTAFTQFLALVKISHDLQISVLKDFEDLLKNSQDGSIVVTKRKNNNRNVVSNNLGLNDDDFPDDAEDEEELIQTIIRTSNICPTTNSIAIAPGHPKYFEVLLLYQGMHLCLHSYAHTHQRNSSSPTSRQQRNRNNNNDNDDDIPDFAWNSPAISPRRNNNNDENDFGESFFDDDDYFSTSSFSSPKRKDSPISRNSIKSPKTKNGDDGDDKLDEKSFQERIAEKTVYDLSKNKIRNAVLTKNESPTITSTNVENGDDSTGVTTAAGEASIFAKLLSRITLQTVYHGTFFTDYAESYFSQIRQEFGISDTDLWNSVALPRVKSSMAFANFSGVHSLISSGRSKSLLSRSHDGRFIFKEIPKYEVAVLRRILPAYLAHIRKYPSRSSLLPRYLALYKIAEYQDSHEASTYVVVMENIFATAERSIDQVFDLKGSMVGRESPKNFLEQGIAAKDHQFVVDPNRGPICIPSRYRDSILRQLYYDVKFLEQINATDYSLLVGVHRIEESNEQSGENNKNDDDDDDDNYDNDADEEILEAANFNKEMEDCPVHRIVNYCQETTTEMMTNNDNDGNNNYYQHQSVVPQNIFFGGTPAFSNGHYVEKMTAKSLKLPENHTWPNEETGEKGRRFNSSNPKFKTKKDAPQKLTEIVYFGLVDTLTVYDFRKKAEFVAKGYLLMKDMDNVSCAPAETYSARFLNFVAKDVFVPAKEI